MKRTLVLLLGLSIMITSNVFAEKINVFSLNPELKIFVDDKLAGLGAVTGYEVEPGSHFIKAMEGNSVVFAKVVKVEYGETASIPIDNFVDAKTNIPNRGSKLREAKRIRDSRGNFAFGVNASYFPGVSVKFFPADKLGIQGTVFGYATDDSKYINWEVRGIYTIVDTILGNMPGSTYVALGYGQRDNNINATVEYSDIALGLEFSLSRFFNRGSSISVNNNDLGNIFNDIFRGLLALDNAYFSFEVGVANIYNPDDSDYFGITGRAGLHYYF
jgi:hypothetical protein